MTAGCPFSSSSEAEAPFCLEQVYGDKKYLNGAIDLLATNPKSTEAFVVDYKTGDKNLMPEEIIESHRMQANFYAFVLMQRGYCGYRNDETEDTYSFSSK